MTKRVGSELLGNINFAEVRALYKSMGFSQDELRGPVIGVANAWSEVVPGHYTLRRVAEFVKKGIYRAGGTAVEFGVIGACDAYASGHDGMKYILPSRELIAASVETMARAHLVDGLVLLGSCDKIIPGMLMGAARLDIPAVLAVGGPMIGGAEFDGRKSDSTSVTEAVGMLRTGRTDEEAFRRLEDTACPGCGSCSFYGTANSMAALAEAMGMSMPGGALIPAVYAERMRSSEAAGLAIVDLVKNGVSARRVMTYEALENAIVVMLGTGASTNCVMHLCAIASEAGLDPRKIFARIDWLSERVPLVAKVNPASEYDMEDFYRAGGVPQVMRELEKFLRTDALTATTRTVGENLKAAKNLYCVDRRVIKTAEDPFSRGKGLCLLRGNLAPDGAVAKPAAMAREMFRFTGPARVFDSEEEANEAILNGAVKAGDVVVVRYEGPRGGPGMREMFHAMKFLYGMGLAGKTALITDGRFSGTNSGCYVGHISPEAAAGGPLAALRDGDMITIDIENKSLSVALSDGEIASRMKDWRPPRREIPDGWLGIYAKLASSASDGAVMKI
ncbi:dihydroxy-acid dehydratase [Cloacibacillus sp. An23]|uniref:dihydroxy-acid dehydratase n=1 Tax=Cloacibacillus sp. An23 TaxID=1965591 RepID=UPI001EF5482A|nr:dihydroxy-acid dehydratase [Cloacibacillus sp. An23]